MPQMRQAPEAPTERDRDRTERRNAARFDLPAVFPGIEARLRLEREAAGVKVLIVAHPDDEVLWFNPAEFDQIVIVYGDRPDKAQAGEQRRHALRIHPLREKILHLDYPESGMGHPRVTSPTTEQHKRHMENYERLCRFLEGLKADSVRTHEPHGEYGNREHVLVHDACMSTLTCPVNGKDPNEYRKIKKAYVDSGAWTWY